jgi:hypothetical protein
VVGAKLKQRIFSGFLAINANQLRFTAIDWH